MGFSATLPGVPAVLVATTLIALHLGLCAGLAFAVDLTADEPGYLLAGRAIVADWAFLAPQERLHGPLGLAANQLFASGLDPSDPATLPYARLGLLPFSLLLCVATWRWSKELFGDGAAGLLSLALLALSPTLLGFGALLAVDTAFAATTTLALWQLWRWLVAPSALRACAWGAAVGLCVGAKYLGLIVAASIPLLLLVDLALRWRGHRPRLGRHGLQVLLAGVVAIVALHGTYAFAVGGFDPDALPLRSGPLRAVAGIPGVGALLQLLPAPFVAGADYQAWVSGGMSSGFAEFDHPHPAYYFMTLLAKTALPVLLCGVVGLVVVRFVVAARRSDPQAGRLVTFFLVAGVPGAVLFGYLSFVSKLQLGVRYVLPLYPLMMVVGGAVLARRRDAAVGRLRYGFALAMVGWLGVDLLASWPHQHGHYNLLVGGPAGGHRWFPDSNSDWGQLRERGVATLRERHPGVELLRSSDGPRFGRVAVYVPDMKAPDVERPGRRYHWARRFAAIDHLAAAWLVYDIAAADFERCAAAGDERAARELALAWLRAGDLERAQAAVAGRDGPKFDAVRQLVPLYDAAARADPERRRQAMQLLYGMGRADMAYDLLAGSGAGASASELFLALWSAGNPEQAVQLLRDREQSGSVLGVEDVLLLAGGLHELAQFAEARAVLDRHPEPEAGHALMPIYQKLRDDIVRKDDAMQRLWTVGESGSPSERGGR